ncbi:hypothetical protein L6R46_15740 [Myxococcota bacterium]|nr:hypothetical protein [Myxococcota bacterium]
MEPLDALLDALPAAPAPPRFTLVHARERRLRPMFLVELLVACVLTACLLPLVILGFVLLNLLTGGQLFDVEDLLSRTFTEHHTVTISGPNAERARLTLHDEAQEAAMMARLLRAVAARRLTLVERIEGVAEPVAVWDGDAPRLLRAEASAEAEAEGWTVEGAGDSLRLSAIAAPRPKLVAALLLTVGLPLLWWTPAQRAARRDLLADWRGEPGERTTLSLSSEALTLAWSRGERLDQLVVPRAELLSLGFLPSLSVGGPVERRGPRLRLWRGPRRLGAGRRQAHSGGAAPRKPQPSPTTMGDSLDLSRRLAPRHPCVELLNTPNRESSVSRSAECL